MATNAGVIRNLSPDVVKKVSNDDTEGVFNDDRNMESEIARLH